MKYNYLIFLVVFLIVLFRSSLVVLLNNINKSLFTYNENIDAGAPLIGVCPQDQLPAIQEVIMRVQTEWTEKD